MTDFWDESPLEAAKKSTAPARSKRTPTAKPTVAHKISDTPKTVMEQFAELDTALAAAEAEEDALLAKHGISAEPLVRAGLPYTSLDTPGSGAKKIVIGKGTRKPFEEETYTSSGTPSKPDAPTALPPLAILEPTASLTQREMYALREVAVNGRLTLQMLAERLAYLEGRDDIDVAKFAASLRRGALVTLQDKKCLKKISPPKVGKNPLSPFFIATHLGVARLEDPLPTEDEMLEDDFQHDYVNRMEHMEILNIASAVIQFQTGAIKLAGDKAGTARKQALLSIPPQPLITRLQIEQAASVVERVKFSSDMFTLQRKASAEFLDLKEEDGGLPRVPNGQWNMKDMTRQDAENMMRVMEGSLSHVRKINGEEVTQALPPAWLFTTYSAIGRRQRQQAHCVIVQPNIETAPDRFKSGCIAVRVESSLRDTAEIQTDLLQLFSANHNFARVIVLTYSESIKSRVSTAWGDLIDSGKIPKGWADWLMYGFYAPLNSSKDALPHFSKPAPYAPARTWFEG